ncbi:Integral membrane protein of the Golgi [Perkinsus chesapeaki]|uniref:Integral membrane protein of the Golgi n=1 Tax=Perkinsus chesapeaki TaxID=330153 RepID=A0A7J6LXE0_PERCH|nr:Integral membrane protein of the Golgi [Perkinsus chesapeaki]
MAAGGRFFGKETFDPKFICVQILAMQACYYLILVISASTLDRLCGVPVALSRFFRDDNIGFSTTESSVMTSVLVLMSPLMSVILTYIVERAKKCLDFVVTYHIWHMASTTIEMGRLPSYWPRELRAICETRWNACSRSLDIIRIRLEAVYKLLDCVIDNDGPDWRANAEALSNALAIMRWILSVMSASSIEMQKIDFHLSVQSDVQKICIRSSCSLVLVSGTGSGVLPSSLRRIHCAKSSRLTRFLSDQSAERDQSGGALRQEICDKSLGEHSQTLYDGPDGLNRAMGSWWFWHVSAATITVLLGEYLCMQMETREIALNGGNAILERRQAEARKLGRPGGPDTEPPPVELDSV